MHLHRGLLRHAGLAWLLICAALLGGCASLPEPTPRPPARAFSEVQSTPLGKLAATAAPSPEISGFRLLVSGDDAFGSLAALADNAQRSLDLQYYLIHTDGSSRALMQRVRAAADRGVRVRLLLDDMNTSGQDAGLLQLTAHPNIEVRVFNPFPAGRGAIFSRVLASINDVSRINQRMHNKMFVADNALAITGGRNLGDAYFVRNKSSNFLDIDFIVAGPAVRRLSQTFDAFWNNPLAYPIAAVAKVPPEEPSASDTSRSLVPPRSLLPPAPPALVLPEATPVPDVPFAGELARGELKLVWAGAKVLADRPSKIGPDRDPVPAPQEVIADDVESLMRSARKEMILISPYFVPGERGVALVRELCGRGVKVRILTNSLATTDAPAVHIGYARYRKALLAQCTELYEMRPHLEDPQRNSVGAFGSSQASLHAKVMVIDGATVLVGSMNMDPRSEKLNTEMGVVVRSAVIADQLARTFEEVTQSSYRLSLTADQSLRWTTSTPGAEPQALSEPEAKLWIKLGVKLLSPFAPDEML
jgi:phosphatidylserine/phosphatidylglycerophosphate/cardiolipin synthase-like enzyme